MPASKRLALSEDEISVPIIELPLNPRAQENEEVHVYNVYNDFLTFLHEVRVYNVYVTKMTESERLASGAASGN